MVGRLGRRSDFAHLRAHGTTLREGRLRVRWAPPTPSEKDAPAHDFRSIESHCAFAWSIPRSFGNAVKRNTLRRRLREIVRIEDQEGKLPAGWYLVTVLPSPDELGFAQLQQWMRSLLDRVDSLACQGSRRSEVRHGLNPTEAG
ncbi:MAG: ribonuclease P protein component [Microthrixaceae bacterium]